MAPVHTVKTGSPASLGLLGRTSERLCGGHCGRGAMRAVVHARVVEQLTHLHLRYVAERLDVVLSEAARTEPNC